MTSLNNKNIPRAGTTRAFAQLRNVTLIVFFVYIMVPGLVDLLLIGDDARELGILRPGGTLINQIVIVCVLFAAAISAFGLGISRERLWQCTWPFLPFALVILASTAWSVVPEIGARRGVRLIIEYFALLLLMGSFRDPSRPFAIATSAFAIVLVADIVAMAFPTFSYTHIGYQGVHGHKNTAGAVALVALPFFLIGIRNNASLQKAVVSIVLVLACLLVLFLSNSKTCLGLFVPAIALSGLVVFLLGLRGDTKGAALSFTVAFVFLAGVAFAVWGVTPIDLVGIAWSNETLTGRDLIWRFSNAAIDKSPLVGVGYGSFWGVSPHATAKELFAVGIGRQFNSAHNGYLDILIQLGWLGMLCVAIFLAAFVIGLFSLSPSALQRKQIFVCVYLFIIFLTTNMTESSIFRVGNSYWLLFLFANFVILTFSHSKGSNSAADGVRASYANSVRSSTADSD